jgi:ABC-2 type transport system ATP-binding protein
MPDGSISIRNLSKSFPGGNPLRRVFRPVRAAGREVLSNINLEIASGEVFGLLGPNGAGKTTLVEILATLLLPSAGEARICGCDVVRQVAETRKRVGYCPSVADSFYPRLSAVENLDFFALLHHLSTRQASEKVASLLDLVGLSEDRYTAFQKLSQGMKQRLSLARALLADPPVLLLDEPSKSLDPLLQIEIWRFLRDTLSKKMGKTILLVTHSLAEAEAVCDRLAIIHAGKIVSVGTVAEVQQTLGGGDLAAAFERAVEGANRDAAGGEC